MVDKKEITYFKFKSQIENFLAKIKERPIQAEPSAFLKDLGFDKEKLVRALKNRKIVTRKESIKDPTNSDEKKAKYFVKYTIIRDGFENKLMQMYNDYFKKQELNECDGCGCSDGAASIGGTSSCSVGGQYVQPLGQIQRRPAYLAGNANKKNKKVPEPEEILGKTVTAESKRKIYVTESQMQYILSKQGLLSEDVDGASIGGTTTTFSVGAETTRGDMGYDYPAFAKNKNGNQNKKQNGTNSKFFADAMDRTPGLSCSDHIGKDGKVR